MVIRLSTATTVPTDISKQVRERDQASSQAVSAGHFSKTFGQSSAVSNDGIVAINRHLRSGFESYRGGHQVQQKTYEPVVDRVELSGRIHTINDNNRALSQGSHVQLEAQKPPPAAEMIAASKGLASKLAATPNAARAAQSAQLSRAGAESLLA